MSKLSLICVYNQKDTLEQCLLKGLKIQTITPEIILMDNTQNKYSSAVAALQAGANIATGDYFVFVHQDIEFLTPTIVEEIISFFDQGYKFIGSSGVKKFDPKMVSNVFTKTFDPKYPANSLTRRFTTPTLVETVDECLFGMDTETYKKIGLNLELCDNWHMYAVEACYHAKLLKTKVYALPLKLFHKSGGVISLSFIESLKKVCKYYHLLWVSAPCYHFFTFKPFMYALYYWWGQHYKLKKKGCNIEYKTEF